MNLRNGRVLETDMAMLDLDLIPKTCLASEAGLEIGVNSVIITDTHIRISNLRIYAIEDMVHMREFVFGTDATISLADPTNREGRIAAHNIQGSKASTVDLRGRP